MSGVDCVDCPICITPYNKTKLLRQVTCPHCSYKACNRCVRQYMTSTMQEPHCMKCRVGWNMDFVLSQFPKTFMAGEYRQHRESLLLDRQKAMLTETMPYVDLEDRRRRRREAMAALYLERRVITEKLALIQLLDGQDCTQLPVDTEALDEILEERHPDVRAIRGIEAKAEDETRPEPEKKARVYRVQPCPAEGCNGFLSPQYQCMKCQATACRDCLHVLSRAEDKGETKILQAIEAHVCDPAQVESVRLIRNQYRACPKCGVMIEKSMGCAQIWCTQCHTAFDYHTGKIETHIHNPHYYEWLRRTRGAEGAEGNGGAEGAGEAECGRGRGLTYWERMNDAATIIRRLRRYTVLDEAGRQAIMSGHRWATHMYRHADTIRRDLRDEEPERKLRISFLRGTITEEKWRSQLLRMDRQKTKYHNYMQLMTMFYETMYDLIDAMITENAARTLQEVVALVEYYREQYDVLAKTYGRYEAVAIGENWRD